MTVRFAGLLCALLIVGCGPSSDGRGPENIAYMKDVAGDVVLQYRMSHGALPASFSQAVAAYPKGLEHRGDAHGRPFSYRRLNSGSFALHCYGRNGQNDLGGNDDLVLIWSESKGWETIDDADDSARRDKTQAIFDRAEREEIDAMTSKLRPPGVGDTKGADQGK